jgi:hypothetical protein
MESEILPRAVGGFFAFSTIYPMQLQALTFLRLRRLFITGQKSGVLSAE